MWTTKTAGRFLRGAAVLLLGLGLQTAAAAQVRGTWIGVTSPYGLPYGASARYPSSSFQGVPAFNAPPALQVGTWNVSHSGLNDYYWFQPYPTYDWTMVGGTTYYRLDSYGAWVLQREAARRAALDRAYRQGQLDARGQGS